MILKKRGRMKEFIQKQFNVNVRREIGKLV